MPAGVSNARLRNMGLNLFTSVESLVQEKTWFESVWQEGHLRTVSGTDSKVEGNLKPSRQERVTLGAKVGK